MNTALVLAAGVGQRMRNGGLPKQFLKLMGKPIIVYTLEVFERCEDVDKVVIACHGSYIEYMQELIRLYQLQKVERVIVGGQDRQSSVEKGLKTIQEFSGEEDLVIIHDGVRPLIREATITQNVQVAKQYGCAITVHPVTESVVITDSEEARLSDFMKRADTYSMTAPQTFHLGRILKAYQEYEKVGDEEIPLLDAAMVYSRMGGEVHLVKEHNSNIKITTPEDFYYLKAILDLEENKYIFGL